MFHVYIMQSVLGLRLIHVTFRVSLVVVFVVAIVTINYYHSSLTNIGQRYNDYRRSAAQLVRRTSKEAEVVNPPLHFQLQRREKSLERHRQLEFHRLHLQTKRLQQFSAGFSSLYVEAHQSSHRPHNASCQLVLYNMQTNK